MKIAMMFPSENMSVHFISLYIYTDRLFHCYICRASPFVILGGGGALKEIISQTD